MENSEKERVRENKGKLLNLEGNGGNDDDGNDKDAPGGLRTSPNH